jgi:hypothetical protein
MAKRVHGKFFLSFTAGEQQQLAAASSSSSSSKHL